MRQNNNNFNFRGLNNEVTDKAWLSWENYLVHKAKASKHWAQG